MTFWVITGVVVLLAAAAVIAFMAYVRKKSPPRPAADPQPAPGLSARDNFRETYMDPGAVRAERVRSDAAERRRQTQGRTVRPESRVADTDEIRAYPPAAYAGFDSQRDSDADGVPDSRDTTPYGGDSKVTATNYDPPSTSSYSSPSPSYDSGSSSSSSSDSGSSGGGGDSGGGGSF